ncbi:hypothetical protein DFJ58DRAFT_727166 [Suillus subalutaceus]|uniref:uncharacterized protein n=1 Tax=Suillus subalutaceus TaxID=48586 RepID=UPI001B886319|nr:uncharacterized protein DFJ58DRAFT_727166 [Suillus subalutaceus]KAG1856334.1 hypothetical protein DFJ58DRAFT_727166 [Suillus subalutaceus]
MELELENIIGIVKTLLQKYKHAKKGIDDTKVPFEKLTCALEVSKVLSWEKDEKQAMDQCREHLDIYQLKIDKGKKSQPNDDGPPSGSDKGKIYAVIAKHIFQKDEMYKSMYAEDQAKFTQAVGNHLTYLKGKYKTNHTRFKQTGAGINPEDPGAAVNLLAQVLNDFPWYEDLDEIWRDNPAYAAKTFLSAPAKEKKKPPPPDPDGYIEDSMAVIDNAPNTCDVEDERVDSAANPSCSVKTNLPYDTTEPVINDDFTMEVEREEGLTIQPSLSNKRPLSSPSPPPTHTHNRSSHGTFKNHADCAMGRGPIHSPKPPSSIASSSMRTTACTHSTSLGLLSPTSSSHQPSTMLKDSGAKKSHLGKNVGSEVDGVCGQVKMLTNNMSYVYTVKAAASEYKIAKVNALRQGHELDFQREKAEIERTKAIVVHQRCQESKTLDLQVLKAQAKVHAERKAALQLEIELIKLKGGAD